MKFSEMPYERPDVEEMKKGFRAFTERLKNAASYEEAREVFLEYDKQYKKDDAELRALIELCLDHGLLAMECRYSGYNAEQVAYLEKLADEYGLLKSGGSDFHGDNKPHIKLGTGIDNELDVPYEWFERLKETAAKIHRVQQRV